MNMLADLSNQSSNENLSVEIGMDCLQAAATDLNLNFNSGNLGSIVKGAISIHPESRMYIMLAGILLHEDVCSDNLRGFISELGYSL